MTQTLYMLTQWHYYLPIFQLINTVIIPTVMKSHLMKNIPILAETKSLEGHVRC